MDAIHHMCYSFVSHFAQITEYYNGNDVSCILELLDMLYVKDESVFKAFVSSIPPLTLPGTILFLKNYLFLLTIDSFSSYLPIVSCCWLGWRQVQRSRCSTGSLPCCNKSHYIRIGSSPSPAGECYMCELEASIFWQAMKGNNFPYCILCVKK